MKRPVASWNIPIRRTSVCASVLAAAALAGCGVSSSTSSGTNPPPPPDTLQAHLVSPGETNASISDSFGSHQAIVDTGVGSNGKLLVFLPGTGAEPRAYQRLLTEAAEQGYHALGIAYPNADSLVDLCGDDSGCYEPTRLEIFDGTDSSDKVSVDASNSVLNRLITALQFLNSSFSDEGWGDFLLAGTPRWGVITISGHSQGGGEAGIIAKVREVARVALFSAPIDSANRTPAGWVNGDHDTPAGRYFGFAHLADPAFQEITNNWVALGMGDSSSLVLVDHASPPYGGSQELETGLGASHPHNATAVDADTPMAGGVPVYKDVWDYVLGQ